METLTLLAQKELGMVGPLPSGELAEHFDSVQRLTFVVAVEDHFEICFDAEDDLNVVTAEDVVRVVMQKLGQ